MDDRQIKILAKSIDAENIIQTHISWLVFTRENAYKIKKPVKFSFLDFSDPESRRHFCQRELELNRRLAPEMYLAVAGVHEEPKGLTIDLNLENALDFAVCMKRMPGECLMNQLLFKNCVTRQHIEQIAGILADFHQRTDKIRKLPNINHLHRDYADLLFSGNSELNNYLKKCLGQKGVEDIRESIEYTKGFLKKLSWRLTERASAGYVVDGHGDLHSGNIFLADYPVIFDCIEFNDHFRKLDILDELAFLSMDLELFEKGDLSRHLMDCYLRVYSIVENESDMAIFRYFKLYRANVKIKVNALKYINAKREETLSKRSNLILQYFELFKRYYGELRDNFEPSL